MPVCARSVSIILFIFISACLCIPGINAQETEESTPIDPITANEQTMPLGENSNTGGAITTGASSVLSILRILVTLAVVAAAIYGLVYIIKKASRGNTAKDPFLKILASTPLGPNRSAFVISVGTQAWLVGSAEHGVNLISEIKEKEILDAMFLEDSKKSAAAPAGKLPDFKSFLQRLGVQVESKTPGPDNIRKRRERLNGL